MNKDQMELFEQMQLVFAKKDDIEKMRQEANANFRKLKEENKELILGWIEGIKAEMDGLRKEVRVDTNPLREGIKEEIKKAEVTIDSMLFQSIQSIESSLQKMREEINSSIRQSKLDIGSSLQATKDETYTAILQSRQEMGSSLRLIGEEGKMNLAQSKEETRADLNRLGEGMGNLGVQIRKTIEEITALDDKLKAGFNEVKEELGSMIKFSYADLEKRFTTLESRVKALEKLVLP